MTLTEGILIKLANSLPKDFKKTLVTLDNKRLYSFFLIVKGNRCKEICTYPISIEYWHMVDCDEIDKEPINNFKDLSKSEQVERFLL